MNIDWTLFWTMLALAPWVVLLGIMTRWLDRRIQDSQSRARGLEESSDHD